MGDGNSILDYAESSAGANELQFGVNTESVRVTFPAQAVWIYALQHSFWFLFGLFFLLLGTKTFTQMVHFHKLLGTSMWSEPGIKLELFSWFLLPLVVMAHAPFQFYLLHRYGRVPRTLTATAAGLSLRDMGWFAPRTRFWPADRVREIALYRLKGNLFPVRSAARLNIRVRRFPWNLMFRFSTRDPQLAVQIAEQLSSRLDRPLKVGDARV